MRHTKSALTFAADLLSLEETKDAKSPARFTTVEFAKALKMTALEMFLYFMSENRDLFKDQIMPNDSHKRVLQYVQILTRLCQLEMGGFDEQLLSGFARQSVLFDHMKRFALKVFKPRSKDSLDDESQVLLCGIKNLLIRAHKMGKLQKSGYELIEHFKKLIALCHTPQLLEHPLCVGFAKELEVLPNVSHVKNEIYPKLDQLLRTDAVGTEANIAPALDSADVARYIDCQRQLLCEDFTQPLREYVQHLRSKSNIDELVAEQLLFPHTQLMLNPEFAEAQQHSLIFMQLMSPRQEEIKYLKNVKGGALLCFTTSYDFDNLILATVSYTSRLMLNQGYLNVEVVKQYNIGNIYGKPLIMFETPVFFEPYLRVHNYLSTCSADNFPMRRYIVEGQVDIRPPAYIRPDFQPPLQTKLNESQRAAFGAALLNEFCLIQGPPGTGKTHLSVELVNTLLQNANRLKSGPIIVLTYSNDSLDKFLLKAAQYTDSIVRFGNQSRLPEIEKYNVRGLTDDQLVPPRLKRVWWLAKCEFKEQFEQLQTLHADFDGTDPAYLLIQSKLEQLQVVGEKINTLRAIFHFYQARDKALLAMTTSCAARLNFLFRLLESKCVIFEEAAEIAEPHVLACLTPYTEHVVLIGDHKQLQPHTGNYTQQGLQVSLFERLITHNFPASVLNVQYRMRSCIAELLVPIFYDKLISDDSVNAYGNVTKMASNMYFVNHTHPEEQMVDMSFINKHEAEELMNLLKHLRYDPSKVVILSPYNAQIEYIKSLLNRKKLYKYLVTSVDSYQGLEANIILLSLVRSNPAGQIGFLRLPNRVCVALSRARLALYMIGNMDTLQHGNPKLWGAINAKLRAANAIGPAFPYSTESVA
ncbi:NFX1-type zinc finger-containing protein 1 isoform X2 [Drosophila hydei]|uniref:NFX1-type zinc finger-containing protein 1 isoform X2 n=1 Tax=Drosophila hydei TaxID=7224 RepID=A0A6J2SUH0_DROHY|nr:NFX1-type zinc finger-containing protein 1 isoform X2 [Drosophila hydei]